MRKLYTWNKVFNRVMDIKDLYLKTNEKIDYSFKEDNATTLHYMASRIEDIAKRTFYEDWLKTLHVTQKGTRVLLHYDLIASAEEMWRDINSINIEARSIYIDIENEDIVLCPMPKFFNIDEVKENKWDKIVEKINNAKIFEITEKLDGSNQNASFYNGEVVLCGSTACDEANSWRIVEGYKFLESNDGYTRMLKDYPNKTFCFEFIHKEDPHVVSFKEGTEGLYLLTIRDNLNGKMSSYKEMKEIANKYGILSTKIEEYTLDELLDAKDKFKAEDKEGWVLNIDGYRVKFKTDDYLRMHKAYSNRPLTKTLIEEIGNGTIDDFMAATTDKVRELAIDIIPQILSYVKTNEEKIQEYYALYKDIDDKKEFALRVNKEVPSEYRGYLFTLRKGETYNLLKNNGGHFKKPCDLGLDNVYVKMIIPKNNEDEEE